MQLAAILGGWDLAVVVILAVTVLVLLRKRSGRIETRVGTIEVGVAGTRERVDQVAATVAHVNKAINNRPAGEPSLYELAAENRGDIRAVHHRVDRVESRIDARCDRIEQRVDQRFARLERLLADGFRSKE